MMLLMNSGWLWKHLKVRLPDGCQDLYGEGCQQTRRTGNPSVLLPVVEPYVLEGRAKIWLDLKFGREMFIQFA